MDFLALFTQLTERPREKPRLTPQQIDAELLKQALEDPNITVETHYFDNKGEIKGHGFLVKDGPLITTRFDTGDSEGSVNMIDAEFPALKEGGRPRLKGNT